MMPNVGFLWLLDIDEALTAMLKMGVFELSLDKKCASAPLTKPLGSGKP